MFSAKHTKTVLTSLIIISISTGAFAATTDDVAAMKNEIAALKAKVAQLEQAQADKLPPPGLQVAPANDDESYDPFAEMAAMQRHMNSLMAAPFGGMTPGAAAFNPGYDIKGTDKNYIITFDMPGMDKSKINVEVKNGILQVSGERSGETASNAANSHFYRQERSFGYFSRSIPLPKDAKADAVQAKYDNGILTVTVDKKESTAPKEARSQKIDVK